MYVMLDLRATGLSGEDFAGRLLDEARIAVMPGESFGTAAAGHVRVALTIPDAAFADAFGRLLAFAGELARVRGHERGGRARSSGGSTGRAIRSCWPMPGTRDRPGC
jgi:hypothetical protein